MKNFCERATGMFEAGASIGTLFGASKQAVHSLRLWFAQTGATDNLLWNGSLHLMTWVKDHYILNQFLQHQSLTATETAFIMPGTDIALIYAWTVRNHLVASGLYVSYLYVGLVLTDGHCQHRVQWHSIWTRQNWRMIFFSEEFRFALSRGDDGVWTPAQKWALHHLNANIIGECRCTLLFVFCKIMAS